MVPVRPKLVKSGLGSGIERKYNEAMERSVRQPVVAGAFYPGDPAGLRGMVESLLGPLMPPQAAGSVGVIVPHAGYMYSGSVAGAGLRAASGCGRPDVVVLLGASHSGAGAAFTLPVETDWRTPLGDVAIDGAAIDRLVRLGMEQNAAAFRREHSMEVVLPFLQVLFPDPVPVVPICVQLSRWSDHLAGAQAIARAVQGRRVWIVASSDFTHYEPDADARRADREALDLIVAEDAEGFYRLTIKRGLTICGAGAICTLLLVARDVGLGRARLVDYATSGDVTGDRSAVVGYASVTFAKESA